MLVGAFTVSISSGVRVGRKGKPVELLCIVAITGVNFLFFLCEKIFVMLLERLNRRKWEAGEMVYLVGHLSWTMLSRAPSPAFHIVS